MTQTPKREGLDLKSGAHGSFCQWAAKKFPAIAGGGAPGRGAVWSGGVGLFFRLDGREDEAVVAGERDAGVQQDGERRVFAVVLERDADAGPDILAVALGDDIDVVVRLLGALGHFIAPVVRVPNVRVADWVCTQGLGR